MKRCSEERFPCGGLDLGSFGYIAIAGALGETLDRNAPVAIDLLRERVPGHRLARLVDGARGYPFYSSAPGGSPVVFGSVGVRAFGPACRIGPGWPISLYDAAERSEEAQGGRVACGPLQIQD
jgi:hypothetical protein